MLSLSHFVPRVDALFPGFAAFRHVMGCAELDAQIARVRPRVHGFGHSHIDVDDFVDGTRFVQRALGHPSDGISEDSARAGPALVWCSVEEDAFKADVFTDDVDEAAFARELDDVAFDWFRREADTPPCSPPPPPPDDVASTATSASS